MFSRLSGFLLIALGLLMPHANADVLYSFIGHVISPPLSPGYVEFQAITPAFLTDGELVPYPPDELVYDLNWGDFGGYGIESLIFLADNGDAGDTLWVRGSSDCIALFTFDAGAFSSAGVHESNGFVASPATLTVAVLPTPEPGSLVLLGFVVLVSVTLLRINAQVL